MPRIGFACMYHHPQQSLSLKELERIERTFNPRSTTLRWMASAGREAAEAKLEEIVEHNLSAQRVLLEYVATLPPMLRMLRLSSDLLPFYSHAEIAPFYRRAEIRNRLEAGFAAIGELARANEIRLSNASGAVLRAWLGQAAGGGKQPGGIRIPRRHDPHDEIGRAHV